MPRRAPSGSPRTPLTAVRKVINENLPKGFEEGMQFGMIGCYVPLSLYPAGYGESRGEEGGEPDELDAVNSQL